MQTIVDYHQSIADFYCEGDLDLYYHLLGTSAGRQHLTFEEPLLFALTYMPGSLKMPAPGEEAEGAGSEEGVISLCQFHWDLCEKAAEWSVKPASALGPGESRDAYIAPRDAGKSTWLFKILPLWGAAHGHVKFVAAFADSGPQAKKHLSTFKQELETNPLLREDYPKLCSPMKRRGNVTVSDTQEMYHAQSGFVFVGAGADASSLGLKVGDQRPDLLILDDLEPDEASYSSYQAGQRLGTLTEAILPLNIRARVVLSGTVTMVGSITHQLVKSVLGKDEESEEWITTEKFKVHHYKPILVDDAGVERSMWPEKWPMAWLASVRHTRSFAKNYNNDPMAMDGQYWTRDDFQYEQLSCTKTVLSVDGAVTKKATSDFTGLAVVGATGHKAGDPRRRCEIKYAVAVKLLGAALRDKVLSILEMYPEISLILVEGNQGGELWREVLHNMPVRIAIFSNSENKEVRAGRVHALYQRVPARVVHSARLQAAEEQMIGFPRLAHDDIVDAIGNPVLKFLKPVQKQRPTARQSSY